MYKKLLVALIIPAVFFVGFELVLRAAGFDYQLRKKDLSKPTVAEFVGTVENYHQTVFDPPGYIWIRQDNIVGRNIDGTYQYRWPVAKAPEKYRVAFLGGSTSETGSDHPYPERCIKLLNAVSGSERYEELNVACSSYSTHQSLIALKRYVLPRKPDLVVVYHGWNDAQVSSDGFPEHVKDDVLNEMVEQQKQPEEPTTNFLSTLRIPRFIGKFKDQAAGLKPRVPVDRFRENLEEMARLCKEHNIPLVVVVRPCSRDLPYAPYTDNFKEYYAPFGDTKEAIYKAQWTEYTREQRAVAEAFDHVRLAHTDEYLFEAQDKMAEEDTDLTIFVRDACHNTGIGYQKIAESVAMAVAPELKEQIKAHVQTAAYWASLAEDSMQVEAIEEVLYAGRKAKELDPAIATRVDPVMEKAAGLIPFYELFDAGKWSGEARPDFMKQIDALSKCLEMRPNDYGVILQMFRVCMYNGQPAAAARPMSKFQATTAHEQYQYLKLMFQATAAGQMWAQTEQVAQAILQINPQDREARGFLQQIQQARQQGRL